MERKKPSVFLIGENVQGSPLVASMERRGCECSAATSCLEAFTFIRNREADLVLSPTRLSDGSMYPVMTLLEGSHTTMFYSYRIERGCWWLPALRYGEKCFGAPALYGSEFVILLEEVIKQIQGTLATAERQPLLILPARVAVARAPTPIMVCDEKLERMERKAAS